MFSTARCAHDIYIRALRHVSKKCHICKKKKMTRLSYFFHFHTYWAGAHFPTVPRPIFRKFKTLSNMERMIKKYGRSELKRKGTQEPKNGTEQPKTKWRKKYGNKWGSQARLKHFTCFPQQHEPRLDPEPDKDAICFYFILTQIHSTRPWYEFHKKKKCLLALFSYNDNNQLLRR